MTEVPAEIEERRSRAKAWFESLRDRICAELELLEDEAPYELYPRAGQFDLRPWTRETGIGGGTGGFLTGRFFEKAGVHTSAANGRFTPEMAQTMPGADKDPNYVSASISLILHPRSPRVPAVHMNTRFLSTAESWFGGGADLTPPSTSSAVRTRRTRPPSTQRSAPPATPTTRRPTASTRRVRRVLLSATPQRAARALAASSTTS